MSVQPQCVPVASLLQIWLAGQRPPHCGALLLAQVVGGGLHVHWPVASTLQVEPAGQTPPHCGAGLWEQGTGTSTQSQWLPTASDLQA